MSMPGLYFEEFVVGEVHRHAVTRTVTETDNLLFTTLTMNPQPLHLDEEFAKGSLFGTRIVNSVFTLGLVAGIHVHDLTLGTTVGNLGFEDVQFPGPVLIGDTLRVESEVLEVRESKSRPDTGVVKLEHRAFNQRGELVCRLRRAALMKRRPAEVTA
ncbi:MaoC family dehydratase [Saccharopolyspora sp. NPDC000359]|uniref:MaoC family dehydratase n=1 Tax=Saccharopolyspora sp. NPDC000359 TaxID=3154251 RepID=UPI00331D24AA